jgi:DNA-binding NarL/FixJ family response regulator
MCLLAVKEGSVLISPAIAMKLVKRLDASRQNSAQEEGRSRLDDLTKREKEVLLQLSKGLNNQEIAGTLCIEEQTVRNHVSMIYSKIGVHDRIELLLMVNKMNMK